MKSFRTITGLAVLALGLAGAAHAAPQTYPLVCRGGAGTLGLDSASQSAVMYYAKSPQPAGAGLQPGQCSWVDRAIGPNEPPCLRQTAVGAAAWIFPNQLTQSYFASQNAPWLRSLLRADQFQTFQVYNPGTGNCFVVTRLGP